MDYHELDCTTMCREGARHKGVNISVRENNSKWSVFSVPVTIPREPSNTYVEIP